MRMLKTLACAALTLSLGLAACDKKDDKAPAEPPTEGEAKPTEGEAKPTEGEARPTEGEAGEPNPALRDPSLAKDEAPATFKVKLKTSKGDVTVEVIRDWAPRGADRFYNLVKIGFFQDIALFRVIEGFMAQFGIHGDPQVAAAWREAQIQDDPVKESNKRGMLTFATAGPNTRSSQFFINYADNSRLDGMGFAPFGRVIEGMEVVDKFYNGYGEGAPRGRGPDQGRLQQQGNTYLKADFPELDYILSAELLAN